MNFLFDAAYLKTAYPEEDGGVSVPVFFFDIHDGQFLPDRQGVELSDVDSAKVHGLEMAMTFLKQQQGETWRNHAWQIVLRETNGEPLYALSFEVKELRQADT